MRLPNEIFKLGTCASLVILLSACASQDNKRQPPEFMEHFDTTITDNGSKMFDYQLRIAHQEPSKQRSGGMRPQDDGGSNQRSGNKPERGKMERRFRNTAYEKLAIKLQETGYCREGYLELSSDIYRGKAQIRGECREGASPEDRDKFS